MTAHEEGGCRSVAKSSGCHFVVTLLKCIHCNWALGEECELTDGFRNPKGWSEASAVRSKKIATGWIFKQLLGHTTLGPTKKNANFNTKIQYPCWHWWCVPTVSKKFPDRPIFTESLLQRKCDRADIWMLVFLSLWVWGLPCGQTLSWNCDWKMISKQALLSCVWLSAHKMQG